MMNLAQLWERAFLEKRPTLSLGLFRLAVAFTVGAHVIPSLLLLEDNYLSTAFRTKNYSFFPLGTLRLVEASPDWVVCLFAGLFYVSLTAFALGWHAQLSCLLMTFACYYFYALNDFHIGTLSFDILLVTLFLMCVSNHHGDFLSLDSLRQGDMRSYKRLRPVYIQRLLQLQLAWTFWYTALHKITAGGNWLTENPSYYLMHYPTTGVVRDFPFRSWLGQHPDVCYGLGVALLVFEFVVPFLWFIPKTRVVSIGLGIAFQFMLWVTLHVPTIFLFLFPAMMLLFIHPDVLVRWIESRQEAHAKRGRAILLYDGQCGFCLESVKRLRVLDLFGWVDPLDFHTQPDLARLHPSLTPERCHSEMVLLAPDGKLAGGFDAFRKMTQRLPLLAWLVPVVFLPGARWVGRGIYRWVAANRFLLHRNPLCQTNQCAVGSAGNGSSKT